MRVACHKQLVIQLHYLKMFDRIEHPNNMRNGDNDAELQIKLDHALLRALKAEVCTDTQCRQCSAVNTIE